MFSRISEVGPNRKLVPSTPRLSFWMVWFGHNPCLHPLFLHHCSHVSQPKIGHCSIQGARFLPSDESRSTLKKDCFSFCLNNFLLMHIRPTVDCGFDGHCQDLKEICLCQRTKQMTFWEIGLGLWQTAQFVYNSGGSTGGAGKPRPPYYF